MYQGGSSEDGDDDDELINETEEEKELRLKKEKELEEAREFWNWYNFAYSLAEGKVYEMEKIFKTNFRLCMTHKLFELKHKKIAEFYAYGKYNIGAIKH